MAPKRARGGRGRGGSSSGPSAPAPPGMAERDQPLQNQQQTGPSSIPRQDRDNTTPEHQTDQTNLDPNDSPATQPTETPASTPIRPPPAVQMQPAAGGPGGAAPRGSSRGRGMSKFKPKNIRRSATELKAFAEEDQARAAAAAAIAGRARGRGYARGRAGRGRGDAMGRGRGAGAVGSGVASGPFSAVPDIDRSGGAFAPGSIKREGGGGVSRSGGASNPTIKREGQGRSSGSGGTANFDPQYPDEDHHLARIDIQNINLISSDEDEDPVLPAAGKFKGKAPATSSKGGLKPVRLDRQEHKERTSQVNTGPAVKDAPEEDTKDSDMPMVDEERSTRVDREARKREFKGTYTDDDVQVKDEPDESEGIMDTVAPGPSASRSATALPTADDDADAGDEAETGQNLKKKSRTKKKATKFVIQTEEDRSEWERHLEDLEVLKEELGGMQQQQDTVDKGKGKEDDTEAEKPTDKKEGRLYLFQFPPAMPKLLNSATLPKRDPGASAAGENDVQVTGSRDKNVMDLDKTVKPEEEEEIIKKEDDEPQTKTKESLAAEEGYVGKLIVRESGRVELDWGGSRMLVGRGIETSFLSMGVVVDSKGCYDEEGKPTREGIATGMGKIMGKFLVTPDWESMVDDMERAERRERRK